MTKDREVINHRPLHYARIFRRWDEDSIGFLTWGSDTDVIEVLRQYRR